MTKHPTLGPGVEIDVEALILSKLLVQANSGGGKSQTIRRLLEQTHGICQHIVIDVEGEFHTLREKFDYVLAGRGGDCAAEPKSAALLARRLLELNVSAIIDISELGANDRPRFVKLFLEALIAAPRELWHNVIVVVDEAHMFCPEVGQSESASAVIDLMTRGRKRGFCGVLATQRISKLHKDAAAEANNKLIGRSSLDIDMKRAADELGFTTRDEKFALRKLKPGEFYAFGPALSDEVKLVMVGGVTTTHPKAGQRAAPPTPPKERILKVLGKLADLPAEAEEEARGVVEWREKVRKLELELRTARAGEKRIEVKVPVVTEKELKRIEVAVGHADEVLEDAFAKLDTLGTVLVDVKAAIQSSRQSQSSTAGGGESTPPVLGVSTRVQAQKFVAAKQGTHLPFPSTGAGSPTQQRLLDTFGLLEQLHVEPSLSSVAAWFGSHPRSKGFTNNLGVLRGRGFLDGFALTDEGRKVARVVPAPTEQEARALVMRDLPPKQRALLEAIIERTPAGGIGRAELAELFKTHERTKGFTNNVGALRGRDLITKDWPVQAASSLRYLTG
jgi:hypothetical protein